MSIEEAFKDLYTRQGYYVIMVRFQHNNIDKSKFNLVSIVAMSIKILHSRITFLTHFVTGMFINSYTA